MGILKGKTAVVTGSTSGIGLGCARAFAGAGADIVLNGIGAPADVEKRGLQSRAISEARRNAHWLLKRI